MVPKTVALTAAELRTLDAAPAECVFWQLDPVARTRRATAEAARAAKTQWVRDVWDTWGCCGQMAVDDGRPVGLVLYAPPNYLPGAAGLPTAPASTDAVLMAMAWVHPDHRSRGVGRTLVQAMARDLVKRGEVRAVEAFGDLRSKSGHECPDRCVVPAAWLAEVGFQDQRSHGAIARMRMDLRSTLRWRDEVKVGLTRLAGVVRPAPKVRPQDRTSAMR